MTVDVLIPAYRPGEKFARLLSALRRQDTPVRKIIVVNTEEEYWDRRFEDGWAGSPPYKKEGF